MYTYAAERKGATEKSKQKQKVGKYVCKVKWNWTLEDNQNLLSNHSNITTTWWDNCVYKAGQADKRWTRDGGSGLKKQTKLTQKKKQQQKSCHKFGIYKCIIINCFLSFFYSICNKIWCNSIIIQTLPNVSRAWNQLPWRNLLQRPRRAVFLFLAEGGHYVRHCLLCEHAHNLIIQRVAHFWMKKHFKKTVNYGFSFCWQLLRLLWRVIWDRKNG